MTAEFRTIAGILREERARITGLTLQRAKEIARSKARDNLRAALARIWDLPEQESKQVSGKISIPIRPRPSRTSGQQPGSGGQHPRGQ